MASSLLEVNHKFTFVFSVLIPFIKQNSNRIIFTFLSAPNEYSLAIIYRISQQALVVLPFESCTSVETESAAEIVSIIQVKEVVGEVSES